ncbi:MAG: anaerobic ribonucleoside-triphosphate reductase activating protein [Anaerolineae bacterium]|nr:anaerobic ribonucleoside-triphosphate reductase activating protein [Anaerolineae bacterium]
MLIKGWVRTSLIDYPEHIASVIFTPGCNFRCPMCHNAELVLHSNRIPVIPQHEVLDYLEKRRGLIDGLVVTGGEPTLQDGLLPFIECVKAMDIPVKLDTNGMRPDTVKLMLKDRLVDFFAVDIKAPPGRYHELTGVDSADAVRVEECLSSILETDAALELRTTVVPRLLVDEDIVEIARWLAGLHITHGWYVLQQFRPAHTLDPELSRAVPYSKATLNEMAEYARQYLPNVKVRGV